MLELLFLFIFENFKDFRSKYSIPETLSEAEVEITNFTREIARKKRNPFGIIVSSLPVIILQQPIVNLQNSLQQCFVLTHSLCSFARKLLNTTRSWKVFFLNLINCYNRKETKQLVRCLVCVTQEF